MKNLLKISIFFISIFAFADPININYGDIETFADDKTIRMVVEIPAGSNRKIEYNYEKNTFEVDLLNQKERIINFLPYPGNYGFIPSTLMDKERGGDGDALDILLISESLATGTIIDVIPIGMLVIEDNNENDTKIIAIPFEKDFQTINTHTFDEFKKYHPTSQQIIKLWFLNYKNNNLIKFIKWDNEISAIREIHKWLLPE